MGALIPLTAVGEDGKRRSFGIATGKLTNNARYTNYRRGKIFFVIRYGKKQFLRCTIWDDSPFFNTARRLEKGDTVLVFGEYVSAIYDGRDKETGEIVAKEAYDLYVEFLVPAIVVADPNAYAADFLRAEDPFEYSEDLPVRSSEYEAADYGGGDDGGDG